MSNKQGKRYSKEFKRDAVALAHSSSKTVTEVARDLGVSPEGLRSCAKQDQVDRGEGGPGALTSAEHEELRRLRRRNLEQRRTIEVLKKRRPLCPGERPVSDVYRFIAGEKATCPVTLLCRVLGVPRSSFYAWVEGEQSRRARRRADGALAQEITVVHLASRGAYGVPRVHAELRRLGHGVNHKRVERLMRERGIAGVTRRHRRSLTRPGKQARPAPDLIGRDFTADRPGTRLVGDITYLPTTEGRLYPACWLDLATREVVGYAIADHHRADLVVDALHMAHGRGRPEPGCIAHSDCGSEYTSAQYRTEKDELDMRASTGRTGSCCDNAAAGSFWAVLKAGIGTRARPDRTTARAGVFTYIETFYNRRRLRRHPSWGYLTSRETRRRPTLAA